VNHGRTVRGVNAERQTDRCDFTNVGVPVCR
jgi:hypothetical protein